MTTLPSEHAGDIAAIAGLTQAAFAKAPHTSGSESGKIRVRVHLMASIRTSRLIARAGHRPASLMHQETSHEAYCPINHGDLRWIAAGRLSKVSAVRSRAGGSGRRAR